MSLKNFNFDLKSCNEMSETDHCAEYIIVVGHHSITGALNLHDQTHPKGMCTADSRSKKGF